MKQKLEILLGDPIPSKIELGIDTKYSDPSLVKKLGEDFNLPNTLKMYYYEKMYNERYYFNQTSRGKDDQAKYEKIIGNLYAERHNKLLDAIYKKEKAEKQLKEIYKNSYLQNIRFAAGETLGYSKLRIWINEKLRSKKKKK